MQNQQTEIEISEQNDITSYSELIEHLNPKKLQYLNNLICDSNSFLHFLLKENVGSLKQNTIYIEEENNTLTNESIKNILPKEELLEPNEKELNKNEQKLKDTKLINNELNTTKDINSENNSSTNKNISKKNNNNKFVTKKYKNRGKESINKPKLFLHKKHDREDFDNLLTKVQVHCINFLINFVNDIIHEVLCSRNDSFKDINYQVKKQINHDYIKKLFQNPIKDIITKDITKKYKKLRNDKLDYNIQLYEKLKEKSKWFEDFLDMKYINFFHNYYYYNKKPLNIITINGKTISIDNKKTKSFYYLLDKEKELNQKINDLVNNVYLNGYNKKNPFITTKCSK